MELPLAFLFSPKVNHFISVYKHRNLGMAADSLGISQPALTKSLKLLEAALDAELFIRSKKGMEPTKAGNVFYEYIVKITDQTRAAQIELTSIQGADEGLIRIGAGQMWSWLFIPEIVSEFKKNYPLIKLEITTDPMADLVKMLKNGSLDIVVGDFQGITVSKSFSVQTVWQSEFWAFARSGHELENKENIQLSDLTKFPWSGYIDHDLFELKVKSLCAGHKVAPPAIDIKATSLSTLIRLTRDSNNILLLPRELKDQVARSQLFPLQSENLSLWQIDTGSIIKTDRSMAGCYQVLLELIKDIGSRPSEYVSINS